LQKKSLTLSNTIKNIDKKAIQLNGFFCTTLALTIPHFLR
jgi:hypothetical protein